MTYRERREARAARREQWADSREAKAEASFATAHEISEHIPFGQPILVGHHSEGRHRRDLARIDNNIRNGFEHEAMAEHHRERAEGIRAQLDTSIYSDDPDAIERLTEKVAELEAKRDTMKAFNAARKKAKGDTETISQLLAALPSEIAYKLDGGWFQPYTMSNLNANIKRTRDRLLVLQIKAKRAAAANA